MPEFDSKKAQRVALYLKAREGWSVAFVDGKAVGLVNGSASADYIQLNKGNASLLAESLEVIQQAGGGILAALSRPLRTK